MSADPFTIMMLASAAAGVMDGIAAGKAGKANKAIHDRNAASLRAQADHMEQNYRYRADLIRDKNKRKMSADAVKYNKSGVEVAGSPIEVLGDNALGMELDAKLTEYEGVIKGHDLRNQAATQDYMGRMSDWQGKMKKKMAFGKAAVSVVGAAWGAYGGAPADPGITSAQSAAGAGYGSAYGGEFAVGSGHPGWGY